MESIKIRCPNCKGKGTDYGVFKLEGMKMKCETCWGRKFVEGPIWVEEQEGEEENARQETSD